MTLYWVINLLLLFFVELNYYTIGSTCFVFSTLQDMFQCNSLHVKIGQGCVHFYNKVSKYTNCNIFYSNLRHIAQIIQHQSMCILHKEGFQ